MQWVGSLVQSMHAAPVPSTPLLTSFGSYLIEVVALHTPDDNGVHVEFFVKGLSRRHWLSTFRQSSMELGSHLIHVYQNSIVRCKATEVLGRATRDEGEDWLIGCGQTSGAGGQQQSERDIFKIFGAVINDSADRIKGDLKDKVDAISFSGAGKSRSKLYDLMTKRFAAELGWKYKMKTKVVNYEPIELYDEETGLATNKMTKGINTQASQQSIT